MRAMYLVNYFTAGCIASSLLGWIASLHPMSFKAITFLLTTVAVVWILCWLLDFSISQLLKVSVADLQAVLVSWLAMILIGIGVFVCT
jgi:hypothetical protein